MEREIRTEEDFEKMVEEGLQDGEHCNAMTQTEWDALTDDLENEIESEEAKLSPKTRKGLKSSVFCGPGRSFPIPDCAHVVAARRLIGRYKGPGNKSSILACVSRKAKALGCDKGKKKESQENADVVRSLLQGNYIGRASDAPGPQRKE